QVLARIDAGTRLAILGTSGSWTEAVLEGWIWTASLQVTERGGFDLVVSASGGENLRAGPSGDTFARLEEGTLLEELESEPGWTRVRRTGWIWSSSVAAIETAGITGAGPAGGGTGARTTSVGPSATAVVTAPVDSGRAAAAPAGVAPAPRFLQLGRETAILAAPAGDTLGVAVSGADVEMLGREGSWARVRVEGWAWIPEVDPAVAADADQSGPPVTPGLLLGPGGEAHQGRGVTWELQFISLERAEAVRTDFFEGEPFLLGRYGGPDGPFVYVAIPPERLAEVEGLMPLERVTVTGRVRVASSALTSTPILDLLDIRRGSSR